AAEAAERFRQRIEGRTFPTLTVPTSLGVSVYSLGARDVRDLLEQADKALYAAKRRGRNRVVRWDEIVGTSEADKPEKAETRPPQEPGAKVAIPFHAVPGLLSARASAPPPPPGTAAGAAPGCGRAP